MITCSECSIQQKLFPCQDKGWQIRGDAAFFPAVRLLRPYSGLRYLCMGSNCNCSVCCNLCACVHALVSAVGITGLLHEASLKTLGMTLISDCGKHRVADTSSGRQIISFVASVTCEFSR